ncbi:MAG: class I SAM-dependent methyltransferase [Rugosibacter sp.]|nr:MAG: class I SAM-dependent methyltransferase [Rugosibacter sp.]
MMLDACILCSHAPLEILDTHAARCPQCGLLHNREAEEMSYIEGGGQAVPDDAKTRWRLINARRRLNIIAPHFAGHDTLIDIGCGSGEMLLAAKRRLPHVLGFDTNRPLIRYIRENLGLPVIESYFDDAVIEPDLLTRKKIFTLSHVLEHLEQPLGLVKQIHAAMSPGDLLYIEVPLYTGQSFCQQGYRWNLWAAEHRALYSPQALDFIATHCGFKMLSVGTRIFARGSYSKKTRLRLFFRQPLRFLKCLATKPRTLSIADVMIGDYGFVVLRKP